MKFVLQLIMMKILISINVSNNQTDIPEVKTKLGFPFCMFAYVLKLKTTNKNKKQILTDAKTKQFYFH